MVDVGCVVPRVDCLNEMCHMCWFAVRSLYQCRPKSDGTNIFEERVVVFKAGSVVEAFEKAELESVKYAVALGFKAHPFRESYEQDGDSLIDGYEVWSVLFESRESLDDFFTNRYAKYEYHPE